LTQSAFLARFVRITFFTGSRSIAETAIRGNSIRLCLKQSEVAQVAAGESIVEETHFPGAVLTCRLDVSETDDIEANFADGNLEISLPASKVPGWATTDEVSLTAAQNTPDAAHTKCRRSPS